MSKIEVYTDGACSGNPGAGGWAFVVCKDGAVINQTAGHEANTTNNRMELLSVIKALACLNENLEVVVYTDSQYVQKGITEWIINWVKNNWKNSQKQDVKNSDLWKDLLKYKEKFTKLEFKWVKGHSDNAMNNLADSLARGVVKK